MGVERANIKDASRLFQSFLVFTFADIRGSVEQTRCLQGVGFLLGRLEIT